MSGAAEAPSSPSADRRTSSSADRRKRPRRIAPLLAGAGLAAVFALSLLARWPVHGGLPPGEDKALNARYLAALRAGEALPARDPMMIAPTGRVLAEHFPLGLYRVMKGWTALAPASDAERDRLGFGTLQALLFVAALLWLGFEAGGSARAAIWAGLLALAIPSLTLRTSVAWLRWEVLGVSALLAYGAASARALRLGSHAAAGLAALALPLAAWLWRPSATLTAVALGYGLLRLARGRLDPAAARWLAATALGAVAACLLPAWARHHGLLAGPIGIAALATLFGVIAWSRPAVAARPHAGLALAAGAGLAAAVAALAVGTGPYSDLGPLLVDRVRGLLGSADRDAVGRLYASVAEFRPATARFAKQPLHELARDQFGLLVVAAGLLAALVARRGGGSLVASGLRDARGLIAWIALAYGVLTLLFERSLVVAAPFVAAWAGGGIALAARARGALRGVALALAAVACLRGLAVLPAWREQVGLPGPIVPAGIAAAVAEATPATAVVAAHWSLGYELTYFAGRASWTDGLLEDPENRRRILEVWAPGTFEPPETWADQLRRAGATHVLVGPQVDVAVSLTYVGFAQAPGLEVRSDGTFRVVPDAPGAGAMVQMAGGREVAGFERLWSRRDGDGTRWSLYALVPWRSDAPAR